MQSTIQLPGRYYALLCQYLTLQGISKADIQTHCDIDIDALMAPDASLSLEKMQVLVNWGLPKVPNDIAFQFGRQLKLSAHDIVGYALLSSPTLEYALRLVARYFRLITPTYRLSMRRAGTQYELAFNPNLPMDTVTLNMHLEVVVVTFHEQIKTLLGGRLPTYDVDLSIPAPPHVLMYQQLQPARFHFSRRKIPGALIRLDADILQQKLEMADAHSLKMAEQRCEAQLHRLTRQGDIGGWVRLMLEESDGGTPKLSELAHILHISERSLERYLKNEGLSFQQLRLDSVMSKAQKALRDSEQAITQIALDLGYREAANFSRAFKRYCGLSPAQWRAQFAGSAKQT